MPVSVSICSQVPLTGENSAEELLYTDESAAIPVHLYESETDLTSNPVDLNTASPSRLAQTGLFTSFQIHMLLEYRQKYGELLSIYELAGLPGFSVSRLREIENGFTLNGKSAPPGSRSGRNLVMVNVRRDDPVSLAYQPGSPLKTSMRIRSGDQSKFATGLAYEKDAGESFFHANGPEFLSGYVAYSGEGWIKQVVTGTFGLHQGMGLVNGSGLLHTPGTLHERRMFVPKLKPYASLNEHHFRRGAACHLDLKKAGIICWASHRNLDLSLGALPDSSYSIDWVSFIRTGGLHRSPAESGGRSLGYRVNSGIHLYTGNRNLALGAVLENEISGLTQKGQDSLKTGQNAFWHRALGLHWHWYWSRVKIFGETVISDWEFWAALAGISYQFTDFLHGLLLLHRYDPGYRGMFSSSYGWGSKAENEQGIAVYLHAEPGRRMVFNFTTEIFRFPDARYLAMIPSFGFRYGCMIRNSGNPAFTWKIRLVKKLWQTTPGTEVSGLRPVVTNCLTRLDSRFIYTPVKRFSWQSRLVITYFQDRYRSIPGYAASQQVAVAILDLLQCKFQVVVFHADHWENRIYLYEPGLYYDFNFPVYYGMGQKAVMVASARLGRKVTLSGKASIIAYHNRENSGSGDGLNRDGKKWELGFQARISF